MSDTVLMHGPAFDGSGEIVEREIAAADVPAYVAAGYVKGENPTKSIEEVVEKVVAKKAKK